MKTPMFGVHHQPEGRNWEHMLHHAKLIEESG
jgi:hypothetical protein